MRGHWPCRLIEFVLLAFGPCRGLFNFAWGGQSIMRDESRRPLPWLPPKTIIAVWRGHERRVDGRGSADPDYRGTRYNLHHEQHCSSGQSAGPGRQSHKHRATNCFCLARQPSPSRAGGSAASSAPGWIFLYWQSCPQGENPIFKVQYIFTPLMLPLFYCVNCLVLMFSSNFMRQSQATASFKISRPIKPTKRFSMWT